MADWHVSLRRSEFPCGLCEWYSRITIPQAEPLQSGLPGARARQHQSRWRISIHLRAALYGSRKRKHSFLPSKHVSDGHRLRVLRESGSKNESHAYQIREECHESIENRSTDSSRN